MEIQAKEIKLVPLSEIKLNSKNRNKHGNDQIDQLCKILKYQGFRRPGTISNRTGLLVCGEGRFKAAKKLGMTHMPIMFQDYIDEDQERSDGIADNAIDKQALLDFAAINDDLKDFDPSFDLDFLGIKDFKLDFEPGTIDDQGKLDQKKLVFIECPHCGEKFEQNQTSKT